MVRCQKNAVRNQVPHLRVRVIEVLLHSKDGFSRLILPKFHVLELLQGLIDRSRTMDTWCPCTPVITASMGMNLLAYNKA
jgi:hypothetical protein